MNWTTYDKLVAVAWIFALVCHFATSFAMSYQRTCEDVQKVVSTYESDPAAKFFMNIQSWGDILHIVLISGIFGAWFAGIRRFALREKWRPYAAFYVTLVFFATMWTATNDVGLTLGLISGVF